MTRLGWLLVLGGLGAQDARAMIEHRVEKNFAAPAAGGSVTANLFNGAINVVPSGTDQIEVVVHEQCDVATEKDAAPLLADLILAVEQQGNGLVITASYRQKVSPTWKNWPPVLLTVDLKVPARCDLDLYTRDGDITVGKLAGKLRLRNETGKIFTGEIDGSITVASRDGDIAVTACTGAIDARNVSGPILIGRAFGRTQLATDGGAIEVQRAAGAVFTNGNGADIKVRFTHPIAEASNLVTSGGSITAIFDRRSAATIDAQPGFLGTVTVRDLPLASLTSGEKRAHLADKLNGGGPLISIRASGGNVILRGESPPPPAAVAVQPDAPADMAPVATPAVGGAR